MKLFTSLRTRLRMNVSGRPDSPEARQVSVNHRRRSTDTPSGPCYKLSCSGDLVHSGDSLYSGEQVVHLPGTQHK